MKVKLHKAKTMGDEFTQYFVLPFLGLSRCDGGLHLWIGWLSYYLQITLKEGEE